MTRGSLGSTDVVLDDYVMLLSLLYQTNSSDEVGFSATSVLVLSLPGYNWEKTSVFPFFDY